MDTWIQPTLLRDHVVYVDLLLLGISSLRPVEISSYTVTSPWSLLLGTRYQTMLGL